MKKCFRLPLRANDRSAFSLIELLIVVALISILVLLTGAHSSFLSRMLVRAELEHLYSASYYLQRKALMMNTPQTLFFDVKNNSYRMGEKTYRLPSQVLFGTAYGVKGPPSSPHSDIQNPVTFKESSITFYPGGVIQSGAIYLTDSNRSCTYALSCAVSLVSYLRKYQYTDGWHLIS